MDVLIGAVIIALGIIAAAVLSVRLARGSRNSAAVEEDSAQIAGQRAELERIEQRTISREDQVESRLEEFAKREAALELRAKELERQLEQVSGLSATEARESLLREVEDRARHEAAKRLRAIEEEAKRTSEARVRDILSTAMQRLAAAHASETTVSVIQLSSDEMKGRIIGKEGRNIRALENLTGVDVIIDDTPEAVVLSAFDGVRREVARMTLERLLEDGRIHPARIEEAYYQAKSDLNSHISKLGEQAVLDANVQGLNPELVEILGKLRFRTSYGQNVMDHSVECAQLASMVAQELGADVDVARRAALLHDIGKAVSHEVEGPHALVGAEMAKRLGESDEVTHAMESHHNEVEPTTVEAVIVQIVDALSGARPGSRGESLEHYVSRLRDLEQIAERFDGVDKVYAMQAGREVRVIVEPTVVNDDSAVTISHDIARTIEKELEYPGQIKVTVIRESRSVDFAK